MKIEALIRGVRRIGRKRHTVPLDVSLTYLLKTSNPEHTHKIKMAIGSKRFGEDIRGIVLGRTVP